MVISLQEIRLHIIARWIVHVTENIQVYFHLLLLYSLLFSRAVITALLFKWGKNFGWNLTISHKVREIWENGAFWLAEMSGHMTLEWDLTVMYTTAWCAQCRVHAHDVVCVHMTWCACTRRYGVHAHDVVCAHMTAWCACTRCGMRTRRHGVHAHNMVHMHTTAWCARTRRHGVYAHDSVVCMKENSSAWSQLASLLTFDGNNYLLSLTVSDDHQFLTIWP